MSEGNRIFAPDSVQTLAEGLFPAGVAVAVAYPWDAPDGLLPGEADGLRAPRDRRLREFAAGRRAARAAMRALGQAPHPVPHGPDRAPVWPAGMTGSITHTGTICLAALAGTDRAVALGLDAEEDADLPADVLAEICTPTEAAWLSVQPEELRGRWARLIFSAKECAYKLQYPLTGLLLGFDAFEITPDPETGQFEATLTRDAGPFAARRQFCGRFAFGAGLVLTGMTMPRKMAPV